MTSWPSSASSAAATEESTPPDMATAIRMIKKQPRRHEEHEGQEYFFVIFVIFVANRPFAKDSEVYRRVEAERRRPSRPAPARFPCPRGGCVRACRPSSAAAGACPV